MDTLGRDLGGRWPRSLQQRLSQFVHAPEPRSHAMHTNGVAMIGGMSAIYLGGGQSPVPGSGRTNMEFQWGGELVGSVQTGGCLKGVKQYGCRPQWALSH